MSWSTGNNNERMSAKPLRIASTMLARLWRWERRYRQSSERTRCVSDEALLAFCAHGLEFLAPVSSKWHQPASRVFSEVVRTLELHFVALPFDLVVEDECLLGTNLAIRRKSMAAMNEQFSPALGPDCKSERPVNKPFCCVQAALAM